ncbi:MAG: xanthine dehydrogenase molybdopterin binding subunit [Myxococcales bacterium]|nr:xanthine dehydrogenase molybdopterin binding subunit [Myxococcales bacterium]
MPASSFTFTLNGRLVTVSGESTHTTLLQYVRATGKTGTKEGCAEGDCGACTVLVVERDHAQRPTYRAVNACITLLPMVAGREVVTVEGIGTPEALHPVQAAMVERYGSQCGYCTPGFIGSMFEAYYRDDIQSDAQLLDQLNGNLCRCTGYRPIRDAMVAARAHRAASPGDDLFQLRLKSAGAGAGSTASVDPPALDYEANAQRFLRPTSLAELLAVRAAHPEAELVCGATEIGVYVNKHDRRYAMLVSTEGVTELRRVTRTDEAFVVGGAATLTELEDAIGAELPELKKMLLAFASRQVRNRASLAGNLVTASPIGDMAPVLLALGATITLASPRGERTLPLEGFFVGYRKTVLAPDELVRAVTIPRPARPAAGAGVNGRRVADSFKVSKRREMDISIVAAGFAIELDEAGLVTSARLAYGGVAATPVLATKASAALVGRPWNAETVRDVAAVLREEFTPLDDVRSGKAFRAELVASLFEKLHAGVSSAAQDEVLTFARSADADAARAPSCKASSFELLHESATGHVTGTALYVDDEAARRGMLEVWPVSSPHARAKVVAIDASAALAHPGVVAVLTARDIPGMNDVGAVRHDETLLAPEGGEVSFVGHMVALVVAESRDAAKLATKKVNVVYEPLPAVLDLRAAIAADSFHNTPHVIRRADAQAALASAPHALAGELEIGGQEHFYLESHAAWAEWGDDGDVVVTSSTQHPSEVQAVVSHVLHLPRSKVVVRAPRMGGGFGGKETQGNGFAALVALAAKVTQRPVRVQLDRDVDMALTGKRHPFLGRFRVGFDADGRVLAAVVDLVSDGGWALDLSESICDRALFHLDNAYYLPAVAFSGRVAKTNVVSHTAFRGFGGPQGMVVIEDILDRVARTLGLRPEVVRERNLYRGEGETNTTHYGQHLDDNRIGRIWPELLRSAGFADRRAAVDAWNAESPRVKRGLAVTPVKFGISFTATFLNQAGALVLVYRDGTVHVNHGGTEMGQGLYTKLRGVAMRELGVSAESVRVMKTQTDKVPNTSATAASSGADLNGAAVKAACVTLRERLAEVAAQMIEKRAGRPMPVPAAAMVFAEGLVFAEDQREHAVPFGEVAERAYLAQVNLSAQGFYRTPGIGYDRAKGRGKPFYYFAYGAAVCEVEVDGYSGMKLVRRVDILHDVGDSLNPQIDRGQVEGAFVQGMGWLTGEELKWDAKGRLLAHSASTYQIPSIGDAPVEFHVTLLPDAGQKGTIHGSKAVGEPPLMLAIAVREALRDAVAAFGGGEKGPVALGCPATHEALFHAVKRERERAEGAGARAAE